MAFRYIGTSTTTITNEGTENPTINGMVVTTKAEGDIVFYQSGRYVWLDDMWNYQGDLHTHADVQSALNEIAEAYKGEEVRGSIYDAIALIDTRSAAMEDTIGANITSMVEPIVDRKISTFILDYETSDGNVAQCNLTYEQLRTKLTGNLKAIVHVDGYECDCYMDVHSDYIDVYATSDPMKNNSDTRGTIYYKFNHDNERVTVNYEQSTKKYQEKLTAGPNIIINDNEISAVGGVNTIGIEYYIDTNSTYSRDEITINKTWSEVELYMDAVYDGDWDDYDLWREIQKDCVLKDLRDYPDYSIYPLIGVKYCTYSSGDPVLIFSSRTISNGIPQNNVHYISFIWPHSSWSDQQVETNSIEEFDDNGDNQPLYIKNGSTNSCTMSYSDVMSIINDSRKIFRPQLKVSGTTGSSSYNGTYEFIEYVIPSANYVWLWFKSTIMEQTQEDAPLYYKPSFILIEHKSDDEVRFRMQTFAEYQAKLTAGDGIDILYNSISLSDPAFIKLTVNQGSIVSSFDYTTNPVTEFTTNFVANPIDIADLVTDRFNASKLALNADTANDSLKCTVVNTDYREMDSSPYFKEFVWIYFLYDRSFYRFDYTIIYSDEIRGTVSEISGAITKISTVSNGTGLSLSGNTLSAKLKTNGGILADSDGLYADTSKIQAKLTPGTNITIDNTDPANPVISSTGGGGGSSYTEGNGIDIDSNNVISVSPKTNGGITVDSNGVSVDTSKIQAKLTPGTNITIDNTDPANPVISSTGGGGGSSYTAGVGIDIDSNNKISTFKIKIAHLNASRTPTINHTFAEISSAVEVYGSIPCYLYYSHGSVMSDSVIGAYTAGNTAIIIKFICVYDKTIEYRKYTLMSDGTFTMSDRTTTNYQPKLTAGTGISIDTTTNTISLDLPQAEGGGF